MLTIITMCCLILYFGRPLFIPMSFGLLIAIVCYPTCKWLEGKGWPRSIAVFSLVSFIMLLFLVLLGLLGIELNLLLSNLPALNAKFFEYGKKMQGWLLDAGINRTTQNDIILSISKNLEQGLTESIKNILTFTSATILSLILIPIFGSLFLMHRETFVKFLIQLVGEQYKQQLKPILEQSILTYFRFIKGTFFVYCIVGLLNTVGLLLLGIENAFVFGMITAFMTMVPYVGIIVSSALPVAVALITKDSIWYSIGVVMVFSVVQYLEANIIFPKVVGEQLNLSTWAVLVSIIAGTLLWGISGMILFIPFVAILKIFSDNIAELKALNLLLNREKK